MHFTITTSTSVFGDGRLSTHADRTRDQSAGRIGNPTGHAYDQAPIRIAHPHISHFGLLESFCGAKFPKMGDSLPRTPTNHRAKFDAASFILDGEIRNRTNKQTKLQKKTNQQTNSKRYINTLPIAMRG